MGKCIDSACQLHFSVGQHTQKYCAFFFAFCSIFFLFIKNAYVWEWEKEFREEYAL